jgi:HD superfamily phosphohydrolases
MNEKHDFRYDPLYRIIDETEEMRTVEGNFKSLFDRLKRINNLGLIPEVFEMARYPKYEHGLGATYQVISLLDVADKNIIPAKYRKPLILASLFLHLGHLPYTYSTERALLLASNLGRRSKKNKIKKYVKAKIEKVLNKMSLDDKSKQNILGNIFSLHDYKLLYRYFSAEILVEKFGNLKNKVKG